MTTRYELDASVHERLLFIAKNKEKLVEAWIAETGILPSESVLVQRDLGTEVEFYVRRKREDET